jgi:zinc D-Ala-D-Ala dipeptidase
MTRSRMRIMSFVLAAVLQTGFFFLPAMLYSAGNLPPGFVDVREAIPSVILDIRYFGAHNFLGANVEGYGAPKCILTKEATEALAHVQEELRSVDLSLKIYDCYRPQRAVGHFCRWAEDVSDVRMKKEFFPHVEKAALFEKGYIAGKSGHSRGSTVDLTIVALPLKPQETFVPGRRLSECYLPLPKRFADNSIDMGSGFDCFDEISHSRSLKVGEQQRINRLALRSLMEKHGFVAYDKEWWHFTLNGEPFPDTYFDFPID